MMLFKSYSSMFCSGYGHAGHSPAMYVNLKLTLAAIAGVQPWAIPRLHGRVHAGYGCGVELWQLIGLLAVRQIVLLRVTESSQDQSNQIQDQIQSSPSQDQVQKIKELGWTEIIYL